MTMTSVGGCTGKVGAVQGKSTGTSEKRLNVGRAFLRPDASDPKFDC